MMKKGNILITGVSTGIGKSCAAKFIAEGYTVFGSVRQEDDATKLQAELGTSFIPVIFDVTDATSIENAVHTVQEFVGDQGLDLLINNAGIAISAPTTLISIDEYRNQFEVNLFGVIAVTKSFLPLLGLSREGLLPGKIFNISSVSGKLVYPFLGPYCASKFALEGFSHVLRRELMMYGIKVVIIAPGPIQTPIWEKSTQVSEEIMRSDYGPMVARLKGMVLKKAEKAMDPDIFAGKLFNIFQKRNPAVRCTITQNRFINWIVPRYLISDRLMDFLIKKMLKMRLD